MWLHVNNRCKGAAVCFHQGGITGIMSCHQTGGPIDCDISGRAYNRDFTVFDKYE